MYPRSPAISISADYDVAVLGAGIIGASCALWLQRSGQRVLIIDAGEPGSGASFGNACTIATYACVPVNSPTLIPQLPKLLFGRDSPLSLDWRYAATHLPWLLQFLRHCQPERVRHTTDALGKLLLQTDAGLDPLIEWAHAQSLFVANDCLYLYSQPTAFESARESIRARQRNGVELDVIDGAAARALEPALQIPIHRALHFAGARHTINPQRLVARFVEQVCADGGEFLQSRVERVREHPGQVCLDLAGGKSVAARKLVVACGAHATRIPGSGAEQLPLDTERGYHIEFTRAGHLLSRPVGWADGGFYATPTESALRVAGTVEIAGLDRPANPARTAYLERKARDLLGEELPPSHSEWLGFRPTFPDALPVIDQAPDSAHIYLALGHQHIGLTLGGITGKLICDLILQRPPDIDLTPFRASRFS